MAGLSNGLYRLDYPANDGSGAILSSLVALNHGVFLGSDLNGAMLSGEVRYDPGRGASRVKLRIGMTPDGELVTGLKATDAAGPIEVEAELPDMSGKHVVVTEIAGTPLAVELSFVGPLPGAAARPRNPIEHPPHEPAAPHPARSNNRRARAAR